MTLDDEFATLSAQGQTVLAYTDGTAQQQSRAIAIAAIRTELQADLAQAESDFSAATQTTPYAMILTVDAAARVAIYRATLASLA
jgi:hypothetical protein